MKGTNMKRKDNAYKFINAYMIEEYANLTTFKKVRALVSHMGEDVFEVANLTVYKDGKCDFAFEFEPIHQFRNEKDILTMDEIVSRFEATGIEGSTLQSLVSKQYHVNIEKMNITSIVGLLSSNYAYVTNNFGEIAVDFPTERVR